ncbi:MAG: IS110 family transposase [Deltaproteobacteria bacterium]|nr:MAG: IS110 family transposase [Deltaproteobacteria bacterium]
MEIIALDAHKRYSYVCVQKKDGRVLCEKRINHSKGAIKQFLANWTAGANVAVETVGNWYWIVDEIEQAGMKPKLVHAHKAKMMLGSINKTDKLDARGLNRLQRTGTLPTVWIPPGEIRDYRELPRTRMVFANLRTRLKNRIHSVFDKYGLHTDFDGISDIFGKQGRTQMVLTIKQLPLETRYTLRCLLRELDMVESQIQRIEKRMRKVFSKTEQVSRLMTLPGVGFILAVVIANEIGDISRFATAQRLASYAGTVPRVHSSGGHTRYGKLRSDVNHYLKWAYSEAGNSTAVNHKRFPGRHTSMLYRRIRERKGHAKAVGAVGRHLAEASFWILTKGVDYKEPESKLVSSTAV